MAGCMVAVTLTDATPGDADAIRALMDRVIRRDVMSDEAVLADTLANVNANVDVWLREPARCVHLVAHAGPALVGVVLVKDFWNLCSLFVDSAHQGQGVGRQLVEEAAARCRGRSERGALLLNAATRAIPFYRKLGFTERVPARPLPAGFLAMQRAL